MLTSFNSCKSSSDSSSWDGIGAPGSTNHAQQCCTAKVICVSVPCQRYLAQLLTAKAESFLLQGSLWPWVFRGLSCSFCLLCFSNTAGCFFTGSQQIWRLTCLSNKQCGSYLGLTETCSENHIPVPTASSLLRALLTSSACTVGWGSGPCLLLSCMLQLQNWTCTM